MRRLRRSLQRLKASLPLLRYAAVAAVLFSIGSAMVVGAIRIPDANGVIHGCYSEQNGDLRIVTGPEDCRKSEVAIALNQVGPQGQQGATGPQGPKGDPGAQGP